MIAEDQKDRIEIDPLSACTVRVEPFFGDTPLATATGFVTVVQGQAFLVTNWHVVTGRNADTGKCLDSRAAVPDSVFVTLHSQERLGKWVRIRLPLFGAEGERLWLEHPHGSDVDVVLLRLDALEGIALHHLDLRLSDVEVLIGPAMPVSIAGFPFGLTAGENWPIWKTGHLASDPAIDFETARPAFLVDATTRTGMSGSPVVCRMHGAFFNTDGKYVVADGPVTRFLGVYSGRLRDDSEIGRVWRPFVIREIVEGRLLFRPISNRKLPARLEACPCRSDKRFKYCCGSPADSD